MYMKFPYYTSLGAVLSAVYGVTPEIGKIRVPRIPRGLLARMIDAIKQMLTK